MKKVVSILFILSVNPSLFSQTIQDLWVKKMDGANNSPSYTSGGSSVTTDNDGNIYLAGGFAGTIDFDPWIPVVNHHSGDIQQFDMFLAKYDSTGNYIWSFNIGNNSSVHLLKALTSSNGDNIIIGKFGGTIDLDPSANVHNIASIGTQTNMLMAKYDSSGNFVWGFPIGPVGNSGFSDFVMDDNQNVYVIGSFQDSLDMDPSPSTHMLYQNFLGQLYAKYDSNGNLVWAYSFDDIALRNIQLDVNDNPCIMGEINSSLTVDIDPTSSVFSITNNSPAGQIFIAKYNSQGVAIDAFITSSSSSSYRPVGQTALAFDNNNNYVIVTGVSGIVDFDPDTGSVEIGSASTNFYTLAMVKYSPNKDILFYFGSQITNISDLSDLLINCDNQDNILFSGNVNGYSTFDADPSTPYVSISSSGGSDAFIIKYNASGNYVSNNRIGGNLLQKRRDLTISNEGRIYLTGTFNGSTYFGQHTLSPQSGYAIFLAHYGEPIATELPNSSKPKNELTVYPNPSEGTFHFSIDHVSDKSELEVYTVAGKKLLTKSLLNKGVVVLDLSDQPKGIYFYQLKSLSKTIEVGKIIIR